jgi:pantothenate kinase-related protein Tda10
MSNSTSVTPSSTAAPPATATPTSEQKEVPTTTLPPTSAFDIHNAAMENVFIGISGLIGAGKTTLATALANKLGNEHDSHSLAYTWLISVVVLGLPVYYEPVTDNIYLADFYKDIKKYGFAMQVCAM